MMYREYGYLIKLSIVIVCVILMITMTHEIVDYFKESMELKIIETEYELNERIDELEEKISNEFYAGVHERDYNAQGGIEQDAIEEILRASGLSELLGN